MAFRWLRMSGCVLAAALAAPVQAELDGSRLQGLKARNIGPAGMSGRVAALDAVHTNPDVVWAGAATGGVWRSDNGGLTWQPVFDDQPVHAIGSIAIFQPNPDVVWVGTGEANTRNSASIGNGVYRTVDGGRTWAHAGLENSERVHKIALHPTNPDVAWACATGPLWSEGTERGVFRTTDGGRAWTRVLYVDEKTGCGDLAADPRHPDKLFAAMWQVRRWPWFFRSGGPGSGLYVTHDGGGTWRKLQEEDGLPGGELGRIGLAVAPSDPRVVYAVVEAQKSALLRSDDGGRTWKKVNERPSIAPRPFYFNELRVDPLSPLRVYSVDFEVRVSDDGGRTFATLPGAAGEQIHVDHHAFWIARDNPSLIYDGNDGGVAVSRDRGKTFRFVGNIPLAQFYHVAVDDELPFNVYGGLQDNGSWRGPSATWQQGGIRNHHWTEVGFGDGFDTLPMPDDPTRGYSLWQGGNLMRWDLRTGEKKVVKPTAPEGTRLRFNWNAGLATDPFDPARVYLGSQFVHVSTDRGESWTVVSPDLTTNNPEWQKQDQSGGITRDVTAAENFTTIVSIAPSPVEKGVVWVGSDDGRVHVTRDGGRSWTPVEANVKGVPAHTWVPHIEASRHDSGTAFVVFDNHRRGDLKTYVYRTDDFGRTFRSLATPGLRGYALTIEQDPVARDLLFLGTEFGLYLSTDGGRAWVHLDKTIPTASVMDLAIHPRDHDLVIATHGRALWILDDVRPLRALARSALDAPLSLYPPSPARQHWRRSPEGGFAFGAGEFQGQNRPYGAILTYSLNLPGLPVHDGEQERARKEREREAQRRPAPAVVEGTPAPEKKKDGDGEPKVDIAVADAAGRVLRRFKGPARLGLNRAVWNLRRDAYRPLPRAEDAPPPDEDPSGPEVPPGTYTVTVAFRGHQQQQEVTITPDPRARNVAEDWQRRWDAVQRAGAVYESLADAVWRVRGARDEVSLVKAKALSAAQAKGERAPERLAELPVVKAADALAEGLTALENTLWQPPETTGIQPDHDALSSLFYPQYFITSSWDVPNANQLELLRQAEKKAAEAVAAVNRFFDTDVAAFRRQVEEARLGLLASEPVEVRK